MDELVIEADYRTDSVTGHEDVKHFYHDSPWRMKGTGPVRYTEQSMPDLTGPEHKVLGETRADEKLG